ncbi:phosphoethanolamine transferase EptA [Escherichia fergusonii]|uniref:Phosphoethanolamine transferase EptA n=1 Tax=Escherichia fergusonii (strain ATCC 35469 / DSM 13698 / CCUG 18766 / IAM 14443 / JCM 21226 / LMG 7866 / NBRC 102419 / NCTC 12128 / CDC 0568-73) TaxID=585054 RepID=B7LL53_ESCF3|nr:phosphoethanolamine transferase EptA [Escherichia fergusonii]EGO8189424.1 phosphoethanolamine transferase EptA [Escherichia fergusonii]EIH2137072.1 phosphoethanolamine transferase EptA [Escherichia fergusonii]EIH2156617.1 phosphoethanolamine transferase EptA [Escherichia fergusonii]EIH9409326.1 phosphoethanolamine transferase EptA [Escherichia fergusonii]EIH9430037.1 phosphoethanolamine transferase EptA [Escherichia fergusonii]
MFKLLLKRPSLSLTSWLLLVSVYISVCLNVAFYNQVMRVLPLDSTRNVLVFISMPFVAFSVINIVLTLASFLWLHRLLACVFILVAASAQYFIMTYGIVIDRSMIANIVDTTPAESFALMTPQMLLTLGLSGILAVFIACWIKITPAPSRLRSGLIRGANVLVSVLIILLIAALFYKDYASLFRNNKELVKSLSPSNSIVASWSWYSHQRLAHLPLVRIGEDAHRNPLMQQGERKNLTILIVGETSRAENFSLNGYPRDTNPRLAKDNVVYFPNTASCGTATAVSVPCMFSDMPRKHYDEELAQHQEGLLDVIQRAGINVLWNDNDGGCKGACDRVPHQNMTALNLPGQCINGECYDEVLFHGLEDYINNLQGDGVIVLHTIGSHGPTYFNRYPPQFRKFTPTCDTNEIQTCSQEQLVNTYDNTLVYVDYIVDKAINFLKAHQDKFTTSLVYLSDHGESLGDNGVYLHGLPYAIAPDVQKQVPMLLWLSEDYQKRYGVDQSCLQKQAATQHYSQDNLFSTMLGLTGVQTSYYQATDDILQQCRRNAR